MKLLCVAAAFLSLPGGVNCAGSAPSPPPPVLDARQMKLRRAEELADRFVRRLHETLDYGVPFREMYTTDPELLGRSESGFTTGLGPEAERLYGSGVPGRIHVAFMNVWYLRNVYCAAREVEFDNLPEGIKALNGDDLFFTEEAHGRPREKKTLTDWRREAEEDIARLNRLAELFRQGLPPDAFNLPAYKSKVELFEAASRKAGRLARVEYESKFVKLPEGVPVYVVRREFMDYYFVEERGELKIVFVNILPDFRWPGL